MSYDMVKEKFNFAQDPFKSESVGESHLTSQAHKSPLNKYRCFLLVFSLSCNGWNDEVHLLLCEGV